MRIPIIKINQKGNVYFIGKIKVKELASISTNKIRKSYDKHKLQGYFKEIDERIKHEINIGQIWYLKDLLSDPNIQREQSKERVIEIGEYLSQPNALFPNSIIINLSPIKTGKNINDLVKIKDGFLEFDESDVVATVVDGQHRLAGFNYINDKNLKTKLLGEFELIITIFMGLEIAQQAELFATINGKQRPVNKSILYDLTELSEDEYTELITCHLITKWFNVKENSPWFSKIKMLGAGEGYISQAAFVDALLPLFEDIDLRRRRTKPLPVLRIPYLEKNEKYLIKVLFDYFKSFYNKFTEQWESRNYVLTKTTGFGAIMKLFPYVYYYCHSYNDFSLEKVSSLISKLGDFKFSSVKYAGGGIGLQNELANELKMILFKDIDINELEEEYEEYYTEYFKSHKPQK